MRWPVEAEGSQGLRQILGDLEAEVMECVWDLGSASVKDVHRCVLERRDIAYTTVMTVMTRLAEKGLLVRRQEGRAYVYTPSVPKDEFCVDVVKDFVGGLFGQVDRPVLAHFVQSLTEDDEAQLDLLAEIIEEKRRERRKP